MNEVMKQYDAIIIGFGKAGKTLAAELSNRGWQIAVVERSSLCTEEHAPYSMHPYQSPHIMKQESPPLLYYNDFSQTGKMVQASR